MIDLRLAVDEIPEEFRKAGTVFYDLEMGFRASDGALDLGEVAVDAGVVHQRVDFFGVIARDLRRFEIVESPAEIFALTQYRDPRQPGLETVENEFLVQ